MLLYIHLEINWLLSCLTCYQVSYRKREEYAVIPIIISIIITQSFDILPQLLCVWLCRFSHFDFCIFACFLYFFSWCSPSVWPLVLILTRAGVVGQLFIIYYYYYVNCNFLALRLIRNHQKVPVLSEPCTSMISHLYMHLHTLTSTADPLIHTTSSQDTVGYIRRCEHTTVTYCILRLRQQTQNAVYAQ